MSTSILHDGDLPLPGGRVLDRAQIRWRSGRAEKELVLHYRTPTPVAGNCNAIQAEAKDIWAEYLRSEADRIGARLVQIVPEDRTLTSVGFVLTRDASGDWTPRNFGVCE